MILEKVSEFESLLVVITDRIKSDHYSQQEGWAKNIVYQCIGQETKNYLQELYADSKFVMTLLQAFVNFSVSAKVAISSRESSRVIALVSQLLNRMKELNHIESYKQLKKTSPGLAKAHTYISGSKIITSTENHSMPTA